MLPLIEKQLFFKAFGYQPNGLQKKIHAAQERVVLVAGGERAGKSKVGAEDLSAEAAADAGLYWIVGPDYYQARAEFMYCVEALHKIDAILDYSMPKEGQCVIVLRHGGRIETKSGEDAVKLASFAPKGILMVEAAQQEFENFQKLVNRTSETRGWIKATGTFETSLGWYAAMYNLLQDSANIWEGISISLPTWSNTAIYPGGENDPEILRLKATNPPDLYQERFGGVPCPPQGLVFREFNYATHVAPISFGLVDTPTKQGDGGWLLPAETPLQLWVDPGYAGAYAVEFAAVVGPRVFLVDEVYGVGQVAEQVIVQTMTKMGGDLFQRVLKGQRRDGLGGVIDIAARQHQGMDSHEEVWRRVAGVIFRAQPVPIVDGISRHRTFLSDPMTGVTRIVHSPKCLGIIEEYGKHKYPKQTDTRGTRELPIDKFNHGLKAVAYGLVSNYGFIDEGRQAPMNQVPKSDLDKTVERAYKNIGKRRREVGWLS